MTEKSAATAVIVLAAGAGTRMKSKTPKILHTIGGRSLVGHVLHGAAAASPDQLLSLIHISEPTRQCCTSRMPSSA